MGIPRRNPWLCQWCLVSFVRTSGTQLYCRAAHSDICRSCGEEFAFVGAPVHLRRGEGKWSHGCCPPCRRKLGNAQAHASFVAGGKLEATVAMRKATMTARYGGATTLQAPELRARKEATMLALYGGKHTRSSTAELANSAAKRAQAQGMSLEASLAVSTLWRDETKLVAYLSALMGALGRKLTHGDIATDLGIDVAEVSHKLSKLPEVRREYMRVRDSWLELLVVDALIAWGLTQGTHFERLRRLPSRREIDILIGGCLGIEVQDFATHSRTSDAEVSEFRFTKGAFKAGPSADELKREEARENDIELIFIWEDAILSGGFREPLWNTLSTMNLLTKVASS